MKNAVSYFEIPVVDLARAERFYAAVFGADFERMVVDGNEMALFPWDEARPGVSGALVRGGSYQPSVDGARVYFHCEDLEAVLARAADAGAEIMFPKTTVGEWGWVAEIRDSEGNRIGLHTPARPES